MAEELSVPGQRRRHAAARTAREQSLLREVRWLLSKGELPARLRRLEQMEHAARVWVNGRELGAPRHAHLHDTHD